MITRAKDIMTTELILADPEMTMEEAIRHMVNNRITGMPVVDDESKMIGVVSEYDIMKYVDSSNSLKVINLAKKIHFSEKVLTVDEDTSLKDILDMFIEKKVRRLPVISKANRLVGIITRRDIMRVLFYRSKSL